MAMRDYNLNLVANVPQTVDVYGDFFAVIKSESPIELSFDDGVWIQREQNMGGTYTYKRVGIRSADTQNVVVALGEGMVYDGRSISPEFTVTQNRLAVDSHFYTLTVGANSVSPLLNSLRLNIKEVKEVTMQVSTSNQSTMLPALLRDFEISNSGIGMEIAHGDSIELGTYLGSSGTTLFVENKNAFDIKLNVCEQYFTKLTAD